MGATGTLLTFMARLIGDILLPTLRAHCVRPESLPALLSLRFTCDNAHPAHGQVRTCVLRPSGPKKKTGHATGLWVSV